MGSLVDTPEGKGTVEDVEVLKEVLKVKIEKEGTYIKKSFKNSEVKLLKAGKRKEKTDENIDMKELKALEEGFKRTELE